MPVRILEAGNGRTRHQKVFEDTLFDNAHLPRRNPVVVERVMTIQIDAADALCCRIVNYRNKIGQHRLVHLLRERLPFAFVFLPMSLNAMAENLVKEYAARPPGENGRPGIRFDDGRRSKVLQILHHRFDGLADLFIVRQAVQRVPIECFETVELHSILGFRSCVDRQANERAAVLDGRSFAVDDVIVIRIRGQ